LRPPFIVTGDKKRKKPRPGGCGIVSHQKRALALFVKTTVLLDHKIDQFSSLQAL